MVALPQIADPTLDLADRALEQNQERRKRKYLGMSAIGRPCARETWYSFRWAAQNSFDAATIKRFDDGHATETVVVSRLKAVPEIELHDTDEDGEQWGFKDFGGHFSGHMDGVVLGLVQAPKTWHVFEAKASEKYTDLDKAKKKVGEKHALAEWNATYYAQAVLYMDYAGLDRHYLVCASPGARRWTSCRTDADPAFALVLKNKAESIIFSDRAPERIGSQDSFACRFCDVSALCHGSVILAERNCRTCMHVTPTRDGEWRCDNTVSVHIGQPLTIEEQERGCVSHRYLPDLVPGEQIDAGNWGVKYRMVDGAEWVDAGQRVGGGAL